MVEKKIVDTPTQYMPIISWAKLQFIGKDILRLAIRISMDYQGFILAEHFPQNGCFFDDSIISIFHPNNNI